MTRSFLPAVSGAGLRLGTTGETGCTVIEILISHEITPDPWDARVRDLKVKACGEQPLVAGDSGSMKYD
jgi:hypothetical protein